MDCNNFWSPTGGGVRRYELEKARVLGALPNVRFVAVLPSKRTHTEPMGESSVFEFVDETIPSGGEYRSIVRTRTLAKLIARYRPDVIEVGSPIVMPNLVRRAVRGVDCAPAIVGFWHADAPRAYTGLWARALHPRLEAPGERLGWAWMRHQLGWMDAIFVASRWVGRRMIDHGLDRLFYTPLGVDAETFHPRFRDEALVDRFRAGDPRRTILFFPHRFCEEKGLTPLLDAYEILARELDPAPALVFAGTGLGLEAVKAAAAKHEHVHYLGYLDGRAELARHFASADICLCLSKVETFGLSAAEAMAAGLTLVCANEGSAGELAEDGGAGLTVPFGDARALADAVMRLAREGRREERGARARAFAETFTWDRTFALELAAYREVIEAKRRGAAVAPGLHELEVFGEEPSSRVRSVLPERDG